MNQFGTRGGRKTGLFARWSVFTVGVISITIFGQFLSTNAASIVHNEDLQMLSPHSTMTDERILMRCYCNMPQCTTNGNLCTTFTGCFSELQPTISGIEETPQNETDSVDHKRFYGCLDLLPAARSCDEIIKSTDEVDSEFPTLSPLPVRRADNTIQTYNCCMQDLCNDDRDADIVPPFPASIIAALKRSLLEEQTANDTVDIKPQVSTLVGSIDAFKSTAEVKAATTVEPVYSQNNFTLSVINSSQTPYEYMKSIVDKKLFAIIFNNSAAYKYSTYKFGAYKPGTYNSDSYKSTDTKNDTAVNDATTATATDLTNTASKTINRFKNVFPKSYMTPATLELINTIDLKSQIKRRHYTDGYSVPSIASLLEPERISELDDKDIWNSPGAERLKGMMESVAGIKEISERMANKKKFQPTFNTPVRHFKATDFLCGITFILMAFTMFMCTRIIVKIRRRALIAKLSANCTCGAVIKNKSKAFTPRKIKILASLVR